MFDEWFTVGLCATALLLLLEHWIPWPDRLHRLIAYTLGVAALWAGATIWLIQHGQHEIVKGLWMFAAVGGGTVFFAYGVDWVLDKIKKARKAERMMRHDPELE